MTLDELRAECQRADYVLLHLPPPNSQGYTRRLDRPCGPRGEIICGNADGQTVRFLSAAVLRYLDRLKAACMPLPDEIQSGAKKKMRQPKPKEQTL